MGGQVFSEGETDRNSLSTWQRRWEPSSKWICLCSDSAWGSTWRGSFSSYCFWTNRSADVQIDSWIIAHTFSYRWGSDLMHLRRRTISNVRVLTVIGRGTRWELGECVVHFFCFFHCLAWDHIKALCSSPTGQKAARSEVRAIAISPHRTQLLSEEINTGTCSLYLTQMV